MGKFLDFSEIKATYPILDVALRLGLDIKQDNSPFRWRGVCPFCEDKRSFTITTNGGNDGLGLCGCFKCGKRGIDAIKLVCLINNIDKMNEAAEWIAENLGGRVSNSSPDRDTVPTRNSTLPESRPEAKVPGSAVRGGAKSPPQSHTFDPAAFGQKLEYTPEVQALGISEDDAQALGIGHHRGKLYQALRYPNGEIAGYSWLANGELKLPSKLIPMTNVVQLRPKTA